MRALLCPEPDRRLDTLVELIGWIGERALSLGPQEKQELREIVTRHWRAQENETTEREERRAVAACALADLHRHLISMPLVTIGGADG